ncbi:alkaline-phosphatase-like protein [Zychaea mexicana]|uniref:alkaline-phosphatase-like protein n=1 Tax=Zychaea mexicana TaxID=64656 RepID=UPI0022FDC861|nr:alkaline-phosphatase-like protein [Zychaea mexicana]KAI9490469.1 alkaline-phosphatase-like protein [Zychaea mexicana]
MLWQVQQPSNLICLLAIIQIVGLALFARGFFPYKVYLSGFANVTSSAPPWPDANSETQPALLEPEFDRLVFIVVDALRNDFVLGPDSRFDFVKSQIELGQAFPYTARATAPTVTMPRIKALTTGTVPSFLDAILNIAESDTSSSLQHHDNWVQQFQQTSNRTIHFFGDDTWIRLFPNTFAKQDGTTSFYVSDTVEVDLNVTRHIGPTFTEQDWDAIILHYLGLDHVGHLGGPYSPLMQPKQREMDQAVEQIYGIVAQQDAERVKQDADAKGTLIILCGDHGMNEAGNHGGSSVGETSAALVFMSPRFESRPSMRHTKVLLSEEHTARAFGFPVIDQIDVVPTLAALFSFPIPKNSLGKIIPELLQRKSGPPVQLLRALQLNAFQLGQLLERMVPDLTHSLHSPAQPPSDTTNPIGHVYSRAVDQHRRFLSSLDIAVAKAAAEAYSEFIIEAQSQLASTASDYKLADMAIGTCLMFISAAVFAYRAIILTERMSLLWSQTKVFASGMLIAYGISMFASSFIEEEHSVWYYFTSSLFLLLALQCFTIPNKNVVQQTWLSVVCITQLILVRITMDWNDTIRSLMSENMKWHMLALSLAVPWIWLVYAVWRSKDRPLEVAPSSSGASYIIAFCKIVLVMILALTCALIFLYKVRSEPSQSQDDGAGLHAMYKGLLVKLEFTNHLDQVALGKLIYNYCSSGLFVLTALVYVIKRASVLDIQDHEHGEQQPRHAKHFLDVLLCMITPMLILFSRTHNAPLFIIYAVQLYLLRIWHDALPLQSEIEYRGGTRIVAVIMLCLTQAAFFMSGRSNSIAAVDLSNAYIGVTGYDTVLIGALTFCSNWATSIWWCMAGWILVAEGHDGWWEYVTTQSAMFGAFLAILSVAVTLLREHLFIWTVFSPKYLYQMAWTCLFHWCIQVLTGTLCMRIYKISRRQQQQQQPLAEQQQPE